MREDLQSFFIRTQLTFREWDILNALEGLREHPARYSPARIARVTEIPAAEVDRVLQDLTRRKIIRLARRPVRWERAYVMNYRTHEWQPPRPKPLLVRLIDRLTARRRAARTA